MAEPSMTVNCAECGAVLTIGTNEPCPACGATKRNFGLLLSDSLEMHSSISGEAKDPTLPSKKRTRVRFFSGDQVRVSQGDWVEKERVIDRDNDRYLEIVKDKASGEIIHKTDEPLSAHTGHGSDKPRELDES